MRELMLAAVAAIGMTGQAGAATFQYEYKPPERFKIIEAEARGDAPDGESDPNDIGLGYLFDRGNIGPFAFRGVLDDDDADLIYLTADSIRPIFIFGVVTEATFHIELDDFYGYYNNGIPIFVTARIKIFRDAITPSGPLEWTITGWSGFNYDPTPVPLPATAPMLMTGAAGLAALSHRRRRR